MWGAAGGVGKNVHEGGQRAWKKEQRAMAYFDSSKNRALWEIRLGELRKARAMRESGLTEESFQEETQKEMTSGTRIRITYQELLREEAMASEKNRGREREMARERAREQTREQVREREGMENEMGYR